ncbi:GGDEF domain-containing protein [Terriglobus albidus]|uniref:GGDEF domain-containing protein n=1 Tax=Terriglobus albidus TaxID=1592106 RepID=A0A5B9E4D4_9BACT|nr:GGDEF domain-containing protein [Terriglobus albidus]QEE27153.1 GGDEF domain-containing protein [Terriglobus albidus]
MLNAQLIPDTVALVTLIALLEVFRRRHPADRVRLWLIGMLWIFVECVARMFYERHAPYHRFLHVIALDSYVIAGTIFVYSAHRNAIPWTTRFVVHAVNVLPMVIIAAMYGAEYRGSMLPYYLCCAFALITGGLMATVFRSSLSSRLGTYLVFRVLIWGPTIGFLYTHEVRAAVYWLLATLFLAAGISMHQMLERSGAGKLAIVAGFTMWAFCFGTHPFVSDNGFWGPIMSRFWDLQKFIIMVGMLMVLLDEQIAHNHSLALHDDLTGLPNRRLLEDRLAQAMARAERNGSSTAVVMLDLNGFKRVNDTLGHAAGDHLLCQFVEELKKAVRTADTLARYGGDEFVVVVGDIVRGQPVDRLVEAMRRAGARDYEVQGHTFAVEAAVGAAVFPEDAGTVTELLRIADDRMYRNKPLRPVTGGISSSDLGIPIAK